MTSTKKKSELRIRTKKFASQIIRFFISLDKSREELRTIGKQLLRSGTSVAANYREASRARSAEEFISKIEICSQEADETQLWNYYVMTAESPRILPIQYGKKLMS